ncbi:palmitoyltransferase ERF2 (DHHC zinc finger domain-containing protein) [Colletotrichum truncatum]|uniref:Palmitoyltransferase ERF2 (DHHC zinc finger domain-containing protein) n=1 Tax=Colletotrichum truncatum TaxID=5467 RepID=A0ACC3Z000_COLTU|nr:palmitoyltransferase ERF2 (DHHC zinc finger domain-containing protein) [Colletotrichum truncatum]KAF6800813.1 palmitoyltransferase ERF2 (DHHC zinc finger domain-containing protein) [Colletotrichum truncatum]
MRYEFDGYSEPSSSPGYTNTNSRTQGSGIGAGGDSERHRQEGQNVRSSGAYYGTGRFAAENERHHRTYTSSGHRTGPERSGGMRSEAEWERLFMEALRRAGERRRTETAGFGGMGMAEGGAGFGEYDQQAFGTHRGMSYEDIFEGLFGHSGGGFSGRGSGGQERGYFGVDSGYGGQGGPFGSASSPGLSFEELFGSPGYGDGYIQQGGYTGGRAPTADNSRRGGAGMTWDELSDLFRARRDRISPYGYASGPPPRDLFDRWHSDW